MPAQAAKGQDPKKLAAELQAANDQLTEELAATKVEMDSLKQKLTTVAVRLVEATDQK